MKNGIIFLVVSALVIVILFFSYKVVKNIKAQKHIDELYARSPRGRGFILRVLVAAIGNSKVIVNARIPVKSKRFPAPPATADALIVTRAGVMVVTVLPQCGKLDNPQSEAWQYQDQSGRVITAENPFARNSYMVEVLKHILRKDGFHNISFHSLVVISNSGAVLPRFTYRNMVTENTMLDEIKNIMLERQLSYTEMRDVMMTVRRNVVKAPPSDRTMSDTNAR